MKVTVTEFKTVHMTKLEAIRVASRMIRESCDLMQGDEGEGPFIKDGKVLFYEDWRNGTFEKVIRDANPLDEAAVLILETLKAIARKTNGNEYGKD